MRVRIGKRILIVVSVVGFHYFVYKLHSVKFADLTRNVVSVSRSNFFRLDFHRPVCVIHNLPFAVQHDEVVCRSGKIVVDTHLLDALVI